MIRSCLGVEIMGDFFLLHFLQTPKLCIQDFSVTTLNFIQHLNFSMHAITFTMMDTADGEAAGLRGRIFRGFFLSKFLNIPQIKHEFFESRDLNSLHCPQIYK